MFDVAEVCGPFMMPALMEAMDQRGPTFAGNPSDAYEARRAVAGWLRRRGVANVCCWRDQMKASILANDRNLSTALAAA